MASEIQVRIGLTIRKNNLQYRGEPTAYNADMTGAKGPTPGAIAVSTAGTDVDFSQLETPGMVWLVNLDQVNYVEYGIWDPQISVFYPLGEIMAGESYLLRLSRNLHEQYAGTGTGTSTQENKLRLKANGAACVVRVDAFEK